jgi:PAS domain S-box-containing protein
MKAEMSSRPHVFPAVMVCLAVIAGTGVAGYLYTAAERRSFSTETRNELAAIADMKVRQVTAWREERLGDAKVVQLNPFTARAVLEYLNNGQGGGEIETWMGLLMRSYHYTAVSLWDRDCRRRLWLPAGEPANDSQREFILQALRGKDPILGDLYRDVPTGAIQMTLAVPLLSTSSPEPFGALLLKINPEQFLYPLIQSWPVPSRSAETLLVRRDGNDVVFLNELRHRKDTALRLRLPIASMQLPAAKGALGYEGTLEGVDYRGVPVLAAARGVPGSAWSMIAKVDREEVLAPLRQRTRFAVTFFGVLATALVAGIMFLWSRQTAKAMRASEVRYRRLFEAAKDGILILDVETGMIVDVNPFLIDLLGYPREAFLNKRFWELGFFKDVAANRANFAELRQKGYVRYENIPLESADGRRIEVEFVSNVYLVGNQNVIQCNVRDVTERKRAEEKLRENEQRLVSIYNTVGDVIFHLAVEPEGQFRFVSVNAAFLRVTGLSLEMVAGKRVNEVIPETSLTTVLGKYRQAIDENAIVRWEEASDYPAGRLTGEVSIAPVFDDKGTCTHLVGSVHDITERKRAEEALRESEGRLHRAIMQAPFPLMLHAEDGEVVMISDVWTEITGYSHADIPTIRAWTERAYGQRGRIVEENINRLYGLTERVNEGEYEIQTRSGKRRTWVFMSAPLGTLPDGRRLAMSMAVDVTERKALEGGLLQAQKMESVGRLAGGVAHDFNNLLTVINGYSRLLLGKLPPDFSLRPELEEIYKAGERAAALTRQLLAFSRRQILQPRMLVIDRVIEGMLPMLVRLLGEDVEVCPRLRAEAARVSADPNRLEQAVMNLAVNARDAMPGGGKLTIETDVVEWDKSQAELHPGMHAGRYVMLAVSDTGEGMNEEALRHIFEPFFTTKEFGQGTGLGLSMVHGTVEQSGGCIAVENEPGRGATFKIYLPIVEDAEAKFAKTAAVTALEGTETVLVVEDQPEVLEYTVAVLRTYGYQVIQAKEASEALLVCQQGRERIDLVLTDVVMPKMSGQELAARLRKLRPGMKVLFMSGYAADVIARHGILEKGGALIEKPFQPEQLAVRIREVLRGAVAERETVLLAEDSAPVREILAEILREAGYRVVEACDGLQAVECLRAGPVQLALLDANMPGQGGLDAAREMRRQRPEIKTVLMSAAFIGTSGLDLAALGVDGVLPKPATPELLLDTVRRLLVSG